VTRSALRGPRGAAALGFAAALLAAAAAPGFAGPIRVSIVNGTTGEPGTADLLTLYRLGQGMEPIESVENPGAVTTLDAPDGAGPRPFLVQAAYRGVNYNQPVQLGPDGTAEVGLMVYDPFDEWDPAEISLATWRVLYRRLPDSGPPGLRVDHILIVENQSDPPRTFLAENETLRFRLPPEDKLDVLHGVTATGATGMPAKRASPSGAAACCARLET